MPTLRRFLCLAVLAAALWPGGGLPASAGNGEDRGLRYPADLAWRLVTEQEIQEFSGCPQGLGNEETQAPPLFEPPTAPLGDLPPLEDEDPVLVRPGTQWEVAPFPALDPPPPAHLPPEARARWEADRTRTGGPAAFQGVASGGEAPTFGELPAGGEPAPFGGIGTRLQEPPSALLKPRVSYTSDRLVRPEDTLPEPFSQRRYHTQDRGWFQISVYGGTSGFAAERAYRTLKAAAPNREAVPGIGEEAFLALLPREEAPAAEAPAAEAPAAEEGPAFEDLAPAAPPASGLEGPAFGALAPVGRRRPDLVDPGLAKSRSAPAFQGIPVDIGPAAPKKTSTRKAEKPAAPAEEAAVEEVVEEEADPLAKGEAAEPFGGRVAPGQKGTQVLVAFFPSKGVVVEMAMDDRIGDSQSLIRLAFLVQGRLLQRW